MTGFPEPRPGPEPRRIALRLGCTAVVSAALIAWQWSLVVEVLPRLWPPTDPFSRWLGLAVVLVGSFLILPGVVGAVVGDRLYDRLFDGDR